MTERFAQASHPLLQDDERQRCEIWTRVMGYHRPVSSFNTGKKGEFYERRYFAEPRRSCTPQQAPARALEAAPA